MVRYPPNYTEEAIAGLLAVHRACPFMAWPADEGGYAVLDERSGSRIAGPFPTVDEAHAESERLNAAHRAVPARTRLRKKIS